MVAKKYRIVKTKIREGKYWYHAEVWKWYKPWWEVITATYDNKDEVKFLINNKDELEKTQETKT